MRVRVGRKGRFWGMAEVKECVGRMWGVCSRMDVLVTDDGKYVRCLSIVCALKGSVVRVTCVTCVCREESEKV